MLTYTTCVCASSVEPCRSTAHHKAMDVDGVVGEPDVEVRPFQSTEETGNASIDRDYDVVYLSLPKKEVFLPLCWRFLKRGLSLSDHDCCRWNGGGLREDGHCCILMRRVFDAHAAGCAQAVRRFELGRRIHETTLESDCCQLPSLSSS